MKLLEIAFSTEWFLTVPGILISCGVILLIVALIMFIVGSMKDKKVNVPMVLEEKPAEEPVVEEEKEESVLEVEEIKENVMDDVQVIEEEIKENVMEEEVSTAPVIEEEPMFETVNEEVVIADIPVYEEDIEENTEDVEAFVDPSTMEFQVFTDNQEVGTETIEEPKEEIVETPIVEEKKSIYGGADPLEATQNLPKIDVHHEPYSGGNEEVVTPVVEEPVTEEVVAEEEKESIPEIISIPDDIEEL